LSDAPITITRASADDAGELLALQRLAYRSEALIYGDFGIPPLTQTLDSLEADLRSQVVLKATCDGRIVGSVRAELRDGTCLVGRLIVQPDAQNRGLGSRLMAEIEACFPAADVFELFTGHESARNLYLYRKLGYQEHRRERVSDALTVVFLRKPGGEPGRDAP
jgi:GNAT superfamily N-acetyltransferase